MTSILITGMSGTGKSSVIHELESRGHLAIDTDSDEWCEWKLVPMPGASPGAPLECDWIWREDRIQRLLDAETASALFVSGCKSNQGKFYHQFDSVVLLTASPEIILERIATRTTNPYGTSEEERALVLEHLDIVQPLLQATADVEIDTSSSTPDEVVEAIIALIREDDRERDR